MATKRFQSQFDPEDLAKITHRGLNPTSKRTDEQARVTHQSVESLRTVAQLEETPGVAAKRLMHRFFGGIQEFFSGLVSPAQTKVGQCANYGHVLKAGWHGDFPTCDDCGTRITSLDQVRSSNLKNDPHNYDDPTNTGRKYVN
jgi:hypothetical protein